MEKRFEVLAGLRILIVEDEVMIAMMLEDMLHEFGCNVVGYAASIEKALASIASNTLDGVLLDMNIRGANTLRVAEELLRRSVPFLLVTGYGDREVDPPEIRTAPRLVKPFNQQELSRRMAEVFVAS